MSRQKRLSEMTIKEVLERWPQTAVVFRDDAMVCIGCALAPFCTVKDAAHDYEIPVAAFVQHLRQFIPAHELAPEESDF